MISSDLFYVTRKIFISRELQWRKAENEVEIRKLFEHYGYETVHFETMPMAEQFRVMHEAIAVGGTHGAGFANIICCQEGARIFEIHREERTPRYYRALAASLGFDYYRVVAGEHVDESWGHAEQDWEDQYEVDIGKVRNALEAFEKGDKSDWEPPRKTKRTYERERKLWEDFCKIKL